MSVATLVRVFADHHPGSPVASVCPGCGYRYPDNVSDCPTFDGTAHNDGSIRSQPSVVVRMLVMQ